MLNLFTKIFKVEKLKSFYVRYEGKIGAFTIFLGFVFDNLTLRDASIFAQTTVFSVYIIVAGLAILLLNFLEVRREGQESFPKIHFWAFLALQFALGSLFSMFFVFYSRGLAISTSWPFLALLFANMVGSEIFKKYYMRIGLQISLFFLATFCFCIYLLPTIFHRIGDLMFIGSGIAALILVFVFVNLLKFVAGKRVREFRDRILWGVIITYAIFNIFYFFNIIPPVPLVMKDAGVYHSLFIGGKEYVGLREDTSWLANLSYQKFHYRQGDLVYVLTAIYAPADLSTEIVHDWQYYDSVAHKWVTSSKIHVPIVGGREQGYRLYSQKQGVFPGLWRVNVETSSGHIVGRVRFEIISDDSLYTLTEERI